MEVDISTIVDRIVNYVKPVKIILFGSRARVGDARPDSDVDLVVVYDGPRPKREVELEIRKLFRPPGFSLDLFIINSYELEQYKEIANTLAREVSENGLVVYG